jgi:hypothetical protein
MIRKSGHRFSEKIMLNRFYCVVLAPKPAGRRADLSGDELIPLLGGARTGLFVCRPWCAILVASGSKRTPAAARSSSEMVYRMARQGIKGVGVAAMRRRIRIKGEKRWT